MMIENGRQPGSTDIADQQTAAAGGIDAVEAYEDAAGEARGEHPRAAQGDEDDFEDETGVDDEDEDEIDLDDADDDDLDEDDDDDLEEDGDVDEDDLDEEEIGIDDDGNPVAT